MTDKLPNIARGRRGGMLVAKESKDMKEEQRSLLASLAQKKNRRCSGDQSDGASEGSMEEQPKPIVGVESDLEMVMENQLTNDKLQELHHIFEEADEDGGGGLDMEEFRFAMRKAMGDGLSDHDLDLIFMKVDTNCDGTVDWDEYLSYMLLEYRERDTMNMMNAAKPFPPQMRTVPNMNRYQRFHDSIVWIDYIPNVIKLSNALYTPQEDSQGRYITVTKEGVVNMWSPDLTHQKTFTAVGPPTSRKSSTNARSSIWVTAMAAMPNANMVAIASTAATVSFYDMQVQQFQHSVMVTDLETCGTCMDYWYNLDDLTHAILVWGDSRGNVCALVFQGCPQICILHPNSTKSQKKRLVFSELMRGTACGVTAYKLTNIHDDFILQVRYVPSLEMFMSSCRDRNTSLYMGDFENKRKSYFKVRKGVYTFDYSKSNNTIVTGGKDMVVRVWNPYVPSKPVILLQGHKSAITYVVVHDAKEQVISVSESKDILIFDLSTQSCVQRLAKKCMQLGNRPISAVHFNPQRQALLLATNQLAVFEHKEEDLVSQSLTSHAKTVVCVLYNSLFNQVVSGGEDSMVNVWNMKTGARDMQFVAHRKLVGGQEVYVGISAMNFDPTLRRLITAGRDGVVKIWNFNNGALLRTLDQYGELEVTGIICPNNRIVTCGWNQKLIVHMDDKEDETSWAWKHYHKDDVLSLDFYPPSTIASASFDGNILIWSLETGHVTMRFNAHENDKPLTMTKQGTYVKTSKKAKINVDDCENKANQSSALGQITLQRKRLLSMFAPNEIGDVKRDVRRRRMTNVGLLKSKEPSLRGSVSSSSITTSSSQSSEYRHFINSLSHSLMSKEHENRTSCTAVEKLLFLRSREINPDTATLLASGAQGWVRAWATHHEGGLLGQFNAAHHPGESVVCLATDPSNQYLITGDTGGYIKVWDIGEYCTVQKSNRDKYQSRVERYTKFPFVRIEGHIRKRIKDQKKHLPPPSTSVPWSTVKVPPLLNSFQAHLSPLTSLNYIASQDLVVSGSMDCSLRLWTLSGLFIGIFGQQLPWKWPTHVAGTPGADVTKCLSKTQPLGYLEKQLIGKNLPPDVRQVASSTTLKVLYGGVRPLWRLARNIVMIWVPMFRLRHSDDGDHSKEDIKKEEERRDKVAAAAAAEGDAGSVISVVKPAILGNHMKIPRRHHALPQLPKPRQFQTQCSAFASLPFYELEDVPRNVTPPQTILEIQERNRSMNQRSKLTLSISKSQTETSVMSACPDVEPSRKGSNLRVRSTKSLRKFINQSV